MIKRKVFIIAACGLALTALSLPAQNSGATPKFKFIEGPAKGPLGSVAQIDVPAGCRFLDGKTVRQLLKAEGEPVSENVVGTLGPTNGDWSVMFTYLDIGYVKDDDKDKLNADKLLKDIRDGTEAANKIRARSDIPPIHVIGWVQPPKYNETTHNLEWAVKGESEGREILNYDTRLLGRKGVMQVKLIVDPQEFTTTLPLFTKLMASYDYQSGQKYAEFRPGDKIAKYGLAALVTGGAAIGAAKLGLFAWLAVLLKKAWKLVVVAVAAVAAMFKRLFARLFGGKRNSESV